LEKRYFQKPCRASVSVLSEERGINESKTIGEADVRVLPGNPAQGCRADYLQQKSPA
jgi:hypothetical protein